MAKHHASQPNEAFPLEDRVALLLGRMLLRFNALEAVTGFTLGRIIGDDLPEEELEAIVSVLSFSKLRQLTLALARKREYGEKSVEALKLTLDRAARLEERRNSLVHSRYVYSHLPTNFLREKSKVTARGQIVVDQEFMSDLEKLERLIVDINETAAAISNWYVHRYLGVGAV